MFLSWLAATLPRRMTPTVQLTDNRDTRPRTRSMALTVGWTDNKEPRARTWASAARQYWLKQIAHNGSRRHNISAGAGNRLSALIARVMPGQVLGSHKPAISSPMLT